MVRIDESPAGLGFLPDEIALWRPFQYQTIQRVVAAGPNVASIILAPTGAGKSPIAVGAARMWYQGWNYRTTILTHQRALQKQYMGYTLDPALRQATGRGNWECIRDDVIPGTMADRAPCVDGAVCEHSEGLEGIPPACPYFEQRWQAMRAPIRVLNYPYYFLMAQKGMFRGNALVADEGHRLDKAILESRTVNIGYLSRELLEKLKIPWPQVKDGEILDRLTHPIVEYARFAQGRLEERLATLPEAPRNDRKAQSERSLYRETKELLREVEWLGSHNVLCVLRPYSVIPVLSEQLAPATIFTSLDSPKRLVLLSASIFDPEYYAQRLGLAPQLVDFIEIPSNFPVERRPIYIKQTARMNMASTKDPAVLDHVADTIDSIISQYKGRKGVIHCGSYALGKELVGRSYYQSRFIVAEPGNNHLAEFIASEDGVYIAPAAYEGLDLKDDLCRFNIVAKLSWPNRGDPVTAAQIERVEGYNDHETASALVQAAGRGMRHDMDWCHTYVLDDSFWMLWSRMKDKLPRWFTEAVRRIE